MRGIRLGAWFGCAWMLAVGWPAGAQDERSLELEGEDARLLSEVLTESELPDELLERVAEHVVSDADFAEAEPISLPVGGPRTAASPQALPLPSGEGSITGMGESFSASLTSGALSFAVPLAVPAGRHGVAPSVALGYSSGGGSSEVGYGWSIGVASIARQTDRGLPRYDDRAAWHPGEDRFVYGGSHELVPVDSATMSHLDGGIVPAELAGYQEYRAHIEGIFMRFFRSPDFRRWVVQAPDGTRMDLGALPAGEGPSSIVSASTASLVASPDGTRIASWGLVRTTDAHGSTVHYVYSAHEGERYLSDIYYLSPSSCGVGAISDRMRCSAGFEEYGARVHLVYEARPDATVSYRSGWQIRSARRLRRVEMTSAGSLGGARTLVRRYHFGYDSRSYHSLLTSLTVEGRPEVASAMGPMGDATLSESLLGDAMVGVTLPPMRFHYTGEERLGRAVDGFAAIDGTRRRGASSPADGAGDSRADLFDVNSDGLVDLVVTDPARFRTASGAPAAGVYFNGFSGASAVPAEAGTFSSAIPVAVPTGALGNAMDLASATLVPMDIDGDGRSDYLHLPRLSEYGYFAPMRARTDSVSPAEQGYRFAYTTVSLEGDIDPGLDLLADGDRIRSLDVNADGLVDFVRTASDAIETYLNLGFHPGGEGRFGSVDEAGLLSSEPMISCLPVSGRPVRFDEPDIRITDMNGDGLSDIVRVDRGSLVWWPGLGFGRFGASCGAGPVGAPGIVVPIRDLRDAELATTYLTDLNGDGTSDVVYLSEGSMDVWLNRAGTSFARRQTIDGLRWSRDLERVVRFVDVDGSGTTDVLFARARGWEWVDVSGGLRERLLTAVENGLGGVSEITYGTTAEDYLRDLSAGVGSSPSGDVFRWQGRDDGTCAREEGGVCWVRSESMPMVSTVVRATESRDGMSALGLSEGRARTEYAYHDAYYEGIEQEVRGFGATDVRSVGGAGIGTSVSRSYMHQGRRPASMAADRLAINPYESLAGRVYRTETWDEGSGAYLSQGYTSFRMHRLAVGLDGREITWSFAARADEVRYDHTLPWAAAPAGATVPLYDVHGSGVVVSEDRPALERYLVGPTGALSADSTWPGFRDVLPLRGGGHHAVLASTIDEVDHVGHTLASTAWGRVRGEWGEPLRAPEEVVSHSVIALLDPAQFRFAQTESWTSGHGSAARLGWTSTVYEPGAIDPVRTVVHVELPSVYEFAGDGDGAEGFVQQAEDVVTSYRYDAWGNVTATCAGAPSPDAGMACLRNARVSFDAAYEQLVTSETVVTMGMAAGLTWSAELDRGLGVITRTTDPRGAVSELGYDGLGRVRWARAPDVRGCEGSTMPTTRIEYQLTTDPVRQPVSVMQTTTYLSCTDERDVTIGRSYVDGLGRARAALESGDAEHPWIRSGLLELNARAMPTRSSGPTFMLESEPDLRAILSPSVTEAEDWSAVGYDAFGRTRWEQPLGATWQERTWHDYGALVHVVCDAHDVASPADHVGARTCTTVRSDGQGRPEDTIIIQRRYIGAGDENYRLWPTFRADGAMVRLERLETESRAARGLSFDIVGAHHVERTFAVDSIGRRIASTDADTDARRPGATAANRSWRYLYNRLGDLVAVRDPRGCGQNFYYDRAGRLVGEDYVTCGEAEPHRDAADLTVPPGSMAMAPTTASQAVDVRNYYDQYPEWATADLLPPVWAAATRGLPTGTADRAARSTLAYDERGIVVWSARQLSMMASAPSAPPTLEGDAPVVMPSAPAPRAPRLFDEEHTYVVEGTFDHAGRPRTSTLPEGEDGTTASGTIEYDPRGLPSHVEISVAGERHVVLERARYARDGLVEELVFGDGDGRREPTVTTHFYDHRRRPRRIRTTRTPTGSDPESLSAVSVVMDQELIFDEIDRLVSIHDSRRPEEWPAGVRPQHVELTYDGLAHVVGADYSYEGERGPTVFDIATDYRDVLERLEAADPMHERAAPSVTSTPESRVVSLTWDYDFLGNTTEWTDDAHAFYERSLEHIENGIDTGGRPSTLELATNVSSTPHAFDSVADRGGWLEVAYGDSGNVSGLTVHGTCHDRSPEQLCIDSAGHASLRDGCVCAAEQHYEYRFDELSQITDARRYDRRGGAGSWTLAAHLRYGFDGAQSRLLKEVRDTRGETRYALWPYPGDYELRGMISDGRGRYAESEATERSYMVGGARVVWSRGGLAPGLGGPVDPDHRITLPVGDLLGTAAAVIDLVSGELVEASTYYPNGARETFRAGVAENVPAEPYGFTGKEADEEVGLTYFGMRFLIPRLGRWASPDPLQIHAEGGGEAMNSYHYISGSLLQATDPIGLDDESAGDGHGAVGCGYVAECGLACPSEENSCEADVLAPDVDVDPWDPPRVFHDEIDPIFYVLPHSSVNASDGDTAELSSAPSRNGADSGV